MKTFWNKTKPWLLWLAITAGKAIMLLVDVFMMFAFGIGVMVLVAVLTGSFHHIKNTSMPKNGYYVHEGKVYEYRDKEWSELGPAECSKK